MLSNLTDLGILERKEARQIEMPLEADIPAESEQPESFISRSTVPFISTSLKLINVELLPSDDQLTVNFNGTTYYRLTPDYFAWLRHRMLAVQSLHQSGEISSQVYRNLAERFNFIQETGRSLFGETILRDAIHTLDAKTYKLPAHHSPWLYPTTGSWNATHPVSDDAVNIVKAIEKRAIAAGWTETRLYQNRGRFRFPGGEDYGLVCFLEDGRTIGEVTERSIEIIGLPPSRTVLRFYNPDVELPWIRRIEQETEEQTAELAA